MIDMQNRGADGRSFRMKSLSRITQPDDLVTVKYLNNNINEMIGGGSHYQ